ncbi:MAG TPA: hypothetical protein DDZ90_02030, partial [Planctomycetaceae bacterium]|nr:hypothetical protein [Planctomycetaceae bacterium]
MNCQQLILSAMGVISGAVPLFGYPPPGFGPTDTTATNQVKLVIKGNYRYIYANGIPDHLAGQFPNRNNPNAIRPQHYEYRVPVEPKVARNSTPCQHSI